MRTIDDGICVRCGRGKEACRCAELTTARAELGEVQVGEEVWIVGVGALMIPFAWQGAVISNVDGIVAVSDAVYGTRRSRYEYVIGWCPA